MAKHAKKTKRRKSSGRRRRVSGLPKLNIQTTALQIGGAILASKAAQFLAKDPTKETLVKLAPFAGLAAGIVLPMVVKNPMVRDLATGLVIMGGVQVVKKLMPSLVGNIYEAPIISGGTTNTLRNIRRNPTLNGVNGTPLPDGSVYNNALKVISGLGAGDGSAMANAY